LPDLPQDAGWVGRERKGGPRGPIDPDEDGDEGDQSPDCDGPPTLWCHIYNGSIKGVPVLESKRTFAASRYNQHMTKQLEAIYEDGVLRPLEPLSLPDKQRVLVTVTDELFPKPATNDRKREMEWVRLHGKECAGKWIAVEGDRLVSSGHKAKPVLEHAQAQGVARPLLLHIPEKPELPFGGW
jgi:predicted DNA-binding antitoxin AbrB/MazE fold protein